MPAPVRHLASLLLASLSFLAACATPASVATPQLLKVYATSGAQPWLPEFYECAERTSTIIDLVAPQEAEILVRLGEPKLLASPAFQLDTEDILIVTHRRSPVQNLTLTEARALFAGAGDPAVQIWVYPVGEDVQEVFDQAVMSGRPVTSLARIAGTPQQMSDFLNAGQNAVGILPRHWKAGDTREVFLAATVPVLAITPAEPTGAVRDLLACVQK